LREFAGITQENVGEEMSKLQIVGMDMSISHKLISNMWLPTSKSQWLQGTVK
jgi:hypothetical protein